jgi:hypothetical protein
VVVTRRAAWSQDTERRGKLSAGEGGRAAGAGPIRGDTNGGRFGVQAVCLAVNATAGAPDRDPMRDLAYLQATFECDGTVPPLPDRVVAYRVAKVRSLGRKHPAAKGSRTHP